jgi:hypothetical protein
MDTALLELYKTFGFFGVVVAGISVLIYRGGIAIINRHNADSRDRIAASAAIETNAQLARDSTTDLRVQIAVVSVLRDDKAKLQHDLDECNESLTAYAHDLKDCTLECQRLKTALTLTKADLLEAHEALLVQNIELTELRRKQP